MQLLKVSTPSVLLIAVLFTVTSAWAKQESESEALNLAKTKISLGQAIDSALSAVPGQALSAELDTFKGQPAFVVEVVNQGQTFEVVLDSQNGRVLKKEVDPEDHDDLPNGQPDRD
jgi:uncharacterized membrane protein YkoI